MKEQASRPASGSEMERQVAALLERRNEDGEPFFSDAVVREAISFMCIGLKRAAPSIELPRFALECVGELAEKAGVTAEDPPDEVVSKLAAYHEHHRSPLVRELEALLRSSMGDGAQDAARRFAKWFGNDTKLASLETGERPEGTVPAGPGARFAVMNRHEGGPGKPATRRKLRF